MNFQNTTQNTLQDAAQNTTMSDSRLRVQKIIWAGLLLMAFVYGIVGFFMTSTSPDFDFPFFSNPNPIFKPVGAAALIDTFFAWFLPGIFLASAKRDSSRAAQLKFTGFIVRLALLMSVGVFGLVIAITGHNGNGAVPFLLIKLIGFMLSFPKAPDSLVL